MQVNAAGSFHFVHIIKYHYVTSFKFQANTFSDCGRLKKLNFLIPQSYYINNYEPVY